jgi:hypothetical protein
VDGAGPARRSRSGLWPGARAAVPVVVVTLLFSGLDVLGAVLGARTTGVLGPWAGLALQLVADLSLLLVVRYPFAVTVGLRSAGTRGADGPGAAAPRRAGPRGGAVAAGAGDA